MQDIPIIRIKELTAKLNKWRHEYYNLNSPTVSDAVYDRHYDELKRSEEETGFRLGNSPTLTVGYEAVEGLEKTVHTIPLLSLDKTKQVNELMQFISFQQVMLMHKLDGLTVKLEYEDGRLIKASTRGNGEEGEIITHNAGAISGIPVRIPYQKRLVVVGEAYINKTDFNKLKKTLKDGSGSPYKNSRNMAAGSVRCHDSRTCAGRNVMFSPFSVIEGLDEDKKSSVSKSLKLNMLEQLGFSVCEFHLLKIKPSEQEVSDTISKLRLSAEKDGIPIDGIVAAYNDIPFSKSCGSTSHHYKDGMAFKFEDDLYETTLKSIEWNLSRSGEITPVAVFDAVEIDGCEVSRASLHNLTFIKELELMPGCRIFVSKRNMIIPHIEDNLDRGHFNAKKLFPDSCPCCGGKTKIKSSSNEKSRIVETLHCGNPSCTARKLRQFVHFVGKKAMDIQGLSESTLEKFIGAGWLHGFTDIYRLDVHKDEIIAMDSFGIKSWRRLWDAVQGSRSTTFEKFITAMDIPKVGRTAGRELSRMFNGSLNDFETAVMNGFDFTMLNDFGDAINHNIHEWFKIKENVHLWKELQKMVNIEKKNPISETKKNPFIGSTIVVTGKLVNFTRETINTRIEALGAKAGSAVSRNTDYLICGDKAGSKLDKARVIGVTILSEDEFLSMVKGA